MFAVSPLLFGRSLKGRVITETGSPLPGALVVLVRVGGPDIEAGILVRTDERGIFRFKKKGDALLVRKAGYLPLLYHVDAKHRTPRIVMNSVTPEERVPRAAACPSPTLGKKSVFVSANYRIITDETLDIRESHEGNASITGIYLGNKQEKMIIVSGMAGLINYPTIDVLAHTNAIAGSVFDESEDIRGTTLTGRHWRWAFLNGAHIKYYDASPETAEGFDRLIGSICELSK
jgi:hypothetical protein